MDKGRQRNYPPGHHSGQFGSFITGREDVKEIEYLEFESTLPNCFLHIRHTFGQVTVHHHREDESSFSSILNTLVGLLLHVHIESGRYVHVKQPRSPRRRVDMFSTENVCFLLSFPPGPGFTVAHRNTAAVQQLIHSYLLAQLPRDFPVQQNITQISSTQTS